jgi:nitroreductase
MEFKEVINKRRTIRDFSNKEIPIEIIKSAIEDGFKAPTYNHMREWDFIISMDMDSKLKIIGAENLNKNIDIIELEKMFMYEDADKKEMYIDAIPKQKKMILEAPVVLTVVYRPKTKIGKANTIYELNCLASVWCCIENILLSLTEQNIYAVTYIPQNTDRIKANFDIPPDLEIAAVIPVGYKSESAKIHVQKEIDINGKIHFNKW